MKKYTHIIKEKLTALKISMQRMMIVLLFAILIAVLVIVRIAMIQSTPSVFTIGESYPLIYEDGEASLFIYCGEVDHPTLTLYSFSHVSCDDPAILITNTELVIGVTSGEQALDFFAFNKEQGVATVQNPIPLPSGLLYARTMDNQSAHDLLPAYVAEGFPFVGHFIYGPHTRHLLFQ